MDMTNPVYHQWFMNLEKIDNKKILVRSKKPLEESKKTKTPPVVKEKPEDTKVKKEEKKNDEMTSFAEKRYAGAEKIAKAAKEKGGPALLTYHHFKVKLSYYKKAANGRLNKDELSKEYETLINKLTKLSEHIESINQKSFQELVGKIEVVGELLIHLHD